MTHAIESMTTAALSSALDLAVRRHTLTASNIAHAGTEGYQALRLPFEAHLEEARTQRAAGFLDQRGLETLRSVADVGAESTQASVQVDLEMTELARNAVRFQELVQGLSRHLSLLALAAGDGRR